MQNTFLYFFYSFSLSDNTLFSCLELFLLFHLSCHMIFRFILKSFLDQEKIDCFSCCVMCKCMRENIYISSCLFVCLWLMFTWIEFIRYIYWAYSQPPILLLSKQNKKRKRKINAERLSVMFITMIKNNNVCWATF